jgi:hippurate hydrolase
MQGALGPECVKEMPPKMTSADFPQDGRQEGVKAILLDLVPKK